jgi:hypothetical protein
MLGGHKPGWLDSRLAELDAGDLPAICAAARAGWLGGQSASASLRNSLVS